MIGKFVKIISQTYLNCGSTCDLTDVLASIYGRKTAARPFETIHNDLSVSHKLFSNVEMHQFGTSGTEGLKYENENKSLSLNFRLQQNIIRHQRSTRATLSQCIRQAQRILCAGNYSK